MNVFSMNNFNTPVVRGNKTRESKLMQSDNKYANSAVKSLRKPLGTVTNYINSASKAGGQNYEGLRKAAKKIEFKDESRHAEVKEEQKPQKLSFPVMELVDEELPEMEKMDIEPPCVDTFEDIWSIEEQPVYHLPQLMNWFPFDLKRRGSLDYSFVDDDGVNDDLTFDEPDQESRIEPVFDSVTELDLCMPLFD